MFGDFGADHGKQLRSETDSERLGSLHATSEQSFGSPEAPKLSIPSIIQEKQRKMSPAVSREALQASEGTNQLHSAHQELLRTATERAVHARKARQEMSAELGANGKELELEIEEVSKPSMLQASNGYIITYSVDGNSSERTGFVHGVDTAKRLIVVAFADEQDSDDNPRLEFIAYDHPHITWFIDEGFSNKLRQRTHETYAGLVSTVTKPSSVLDALGYIVEVPSMEPDAAPGDMYRAKIIEVNTVRNTMKACYVTVDDSGKDIMDSDDAEVIPFNSKTVAWMVPPRTPLSRSACERPPLMHSIGYVVELTSKEEVVELGDMYQGTITSVDIDKNEIKVAYHLNDDNEPADHEHVPYLSEDVCWIKPPAQRRRTAISAKLAHGTLEDGDTFQHHFSTTARPPMDEAMGYRVEIRSQEEDAEPDDMYEGVIHSVNLRAGTLCVKFDVESGEDSDYDDVEYLSSDIAWMTAPDGSTKPIPVSPKAVTPRPYTESKHSKIPRPTITGALGALVEVTSQEPDAEPDDAYQGRVSSIDEASRKVTIAFETEIPTEFDHEVYDFDSSHIAWIALAENESKNEKEKERRRRRRRGRRCCKDV